MTPTDAERRAAVQAARRFLHDPASGVVQVGLGRPERGGRRRPELALRFHVESKRPPDELDAAGVTPVPPEFEGMPTDVIERRYLPRVWGWGGGSGERGRFDPLRGGISVSSARYGATGTLGAVVRDRGSDDLMGLSNSHVLATVYGAAPGLGTYQPGSLDGGGLGDLVGRLARDVAQLELDASVTRLGTQRGGINYQHGIGPLRGVKPPALDLVVMKAGRTSGVTSGVVTEVEAIGRYRYGWTWRIVREVTTVDSIGGANVSDGGDSGSVFLDPGDRRAVGLLFAGTSQPETALAMAIEPVLDALGVDLLLEV